MSKSKEEDKPIVSFIEIETENGHDSFLLNEPKFFDALKGFLNSTLKDL